jgi:hypothetical protein
MHIVPTLILSTANRTNVQDAHHYHPGTSSLVETQWKSSWTLVLTDRCLLEMQRMPFGCGQDFKPSGWRKVLGGDLVELAAVGDQI